MEWDSGCSLLNPSRQWFVCGLCGREFPKQYLLTIHELSAAGSRACK